MPLTNAERQKRYRERLQDRATGKTTLVACYLQECRDIIDERIADVAEHADAAYRLPALRLMKDRYAALTPDTLSDVQQRVATDDFRDAVWMNLRREIKDTMRSMRRSGRKADTTNVEPTAAAMREHMDETDSPALPSASAAFLADAMDVLRYWVKQPNEAGVDPADTLAIGQIHARFAEITCAGTLPADLEATVTSRFAALVDEILWAELKNERARVGTRAA